MIKNNVYIIIRQLIPYRLYFWLKLIFQKNKRKDLEPYLVSSKKSKNKYAIFRVPLGENGILSAAVLFLFTAQWAEKKGIIPLLDLEDRYYLYSDYIGTHNLYDEVFTQPIKVSKAIEEEWVALDAIMNYNPLFSLRINGSLFDPRIHLVTKNWRGYYMKLHYYSKKYWNFSWEIEKQAETFFENNICSKGGGVIGVFLREAFSQEAYEMRPMEDKKIQENHPLVPSVKETINIVKQKMREWGANTLFISSVYCDTIEEFSNEFSEGLHYIDRKRITLSSIRSSTWRKSFDKLKILPRSEEDYNNAVNIAKSYAKEILILSMCDYLIAAKGSGAIVALAINGGKFKDINILDVKDKSGMY